MFFLGFLLVFKMGDASGDTGEGKSRGDTQSSGGCPLLSSSAWWLLQVTRLCFCGKQREAVIDPELQGGCLIKTQLAALGSVGTGLSRLAINECVSYFPDTITKYLTETT